MTVDVFSLTFEVGYWICSAAFTVLGVLLALNFRDGSVGRAALALSFLTSVSAFAFAASSRLLDIPPNLLGLLDILRFASWIVFLATILRLSKPAGAVRWLVLASHLTWLLLLAVLVMPGAETLVSVVSLGLLDGRVLHLLVSLLTMLLVEQVFRNTRESRKKAVRFVCMGLGIPAAYEVCLSASTVLLGEASEILVAPRGLIIALGAPLLAVGFQRVKNWDVGIFVSRQFVFYSASVMAVGLYLLAMSAVGYTIQSLGLRWGGLLQGAFISVAIGLFLWVLFSDSVRSGAKVWLQKNFYENRYDYREEWLRLTKTLSEAVHQRSLGDRVVDGLAAIAGSDAGALWSVDKDNNRFVRESAPGAQQAELAFEHPLIEFLEQRRWVVDVGEARRRPDRYESIEHTLGELPFSENALLVPLQHEEDLLGFVELERRPAASPLNFEDHDLLKTAGQQVASHLAQRNTALLLAESRQFEAFNKFTAFVMHDLNNLIAQQELIVKNAEKHRANPAFVDDAFRTIENSVRRMNGLLRQLRERSAIGEMEIVNVNEIVRQAVTRASDRKPLPMVVQSAEQCFVAADRDRLESVLGHMIRNAQEATLPDGSVRVGTEPVTVTGDVEIFITDTGVGMSPDFVREQLFSPFVSTKGSQGMGIGVYQTREYLRSLGGDVVVESVVGQGTTMRLRIPEAQATQ